MSDELSYDDEDRIALDVEIHVAAQGVRGWLEVNYPWFVELNTAHRQVHDVLLLNGDLESAAVFAEHDPCFEDGAACGSSTHEGSVAYPCRALRSVHSGQGVWDELVKRYPAGWEDWEDEEW